MQAYIKNDKIIINTTIDDRDKDELLNFISKSKYKALLTEPLYDIKGNISGVSININN